MALGSAGEWREAFSLWPEGHRLIAVDAYRDGTAQLAALLGAHLDDVSGACDGTLTPSFASGITIVVFDTAATTRATRYTMATGSLSRRPMSRSSATMFAERRSM